MSKYRELPTQTGSLSWPGHYEEKHFGGGYEALWTSHSGYHWPFSLEKEYRTGGGMTGSLNGDTPYSNWPCQWAGNENYGPLRPDGVSLPSNAELSTKLIAKSNPTKPEVNVLNIIGELKDLPSLIKSAGDDFIKKSFAHNAGHLNLSYQFGWAPFFRDMVSLTDFISSVKRRMKKLEAIKQNGHTTEKVGLWSGASHRSGTYRMDWWDMLVTSTREEKYWGYTVWDTSQEFPQTDAEMLSVAIRSSLGLQTWGATAWNLIPWSWLIDWFINIGDFLEATENKFGLTCRVANICHSTEDKGHASPVGGPYLSNGNYMSIEPLKLYKVKKARYPADPPSITAQMPILDMGQLGILGSIAATRGGGRLSSFGAI